MIPLFSLVRPRVAVAPWPLGTEGIVLHWRAEDQKYEIDVRFRQIVTVDAADLVVIEPRKGSDG